MKNRIAQLVTVGILATVSTVLGWGQQTAPPPATRPKLAASWREQAMWAVMNNKPTEARDLLRKWVEADPRDAASWYNLACLEATTGEKGRALDALETAVEAGFSESDNARSDPDLLSLHDDARFAAAVARIATTPPRRGATSDVERRFTLMKSYGTYLAMLPPDYKTSTAEYPLCVLLHGSGSSEMDDSEFADGMGRDGVIYIAVRAPYPNVEDALPGAVGWTRWPPNSIPEGDPANEGARKAYPEWVFDCAADAQARYRVKKGKIFIHGYSQGAFTAVECALTHPERVASIFSLSGGPPRGDAALLREGLPKLKSENVRVYLMHGEEDRTVSPELSKNFAKSLEAAGVFNALTLVKGGHVPEKDRLPAMRSWVDKEIRGVSAGPVPPK